MFYRFEYLTYELKCVFHFKCKIIKNVRTLNNNKSYMF